MPLILLAEDDSSTIDHVRSALASQGWLVKTVGTRDQALRAASEFAPQLVLVNDHLSGSEDLVRTFSRESGGPGVILLTTGEDDAAAAAADVDAVLAKPLDTGALIEAIRRGLVDGKGKPTPPPVTESNKVFSSEEIFGDLLDDILDPEAEEEPAEAAAATEKPEPVAKEQPETAVAQEPEPEIQEEPVEEAIVEPEVEEPEVDVEEEPVAETPVEAEEEIEEAPVLEKQPEAVLDIAAKGESADDSKLDAEAEVAQETIPVAGLEDLEEVVREGVEAWADSVRPEDIDDGEPEEELAEVAEAAAADAEPEPELEVDLESKLDDTLAGVLAASLTGAGPKKEATDSPPPKSASVDDLLSQALGDLDLSGGGSVAPVEEVSESLIDDEIEALASSVEVEPIAEIEQPDISAELAELPGVAKAPEPAEDSPEPEDTEEDLEEVPEEPAEEPEFEIPEEDLAEDEPEPEPEPVEEPEPDDEPEFAPPLPSKGVAFGEYTLEQQIGVGGMASVWKARRKGVEGFEKRVAIKKILPQAAENEDFVEMFIDEAKLAAQLNHSNITHIYDLGKIDDDYFIAMEYVEGKNLRQILDRARKKEQSIPVGVALFIAAQLADALDYAHHSKDFDDAELGLVHRDISPQNVLISFDGDIKLCDFGIAKAVSKISTTQMGALKGKLQYMSPEQAWGKAIDHRSDLFSLGSLLFEMLAGKRLFTGESEMAVLESVREAEVGTTIIQSNDIPAGVKGILLKALAVEADDRINSADEFQRGLEELLKKEKPTPGPKTVSTFVRELLDMQVEAPEPVTEEEIPAPEIEVAEDLAWEQGPPGDDVEEEETTPWLRRVLTRLLPVLILVAVGGGILAGLMQKDEPVAQPRAPIEETVPEVEAPADTDSMATDEETAIDAQNQPPPEQAPVDPSPTPPAQQPTPEPEPEPVAIEDQQEVSAPEESTNLDTTDTSDTTGDNPELERRVEEDLQRVQELMAAPPEAADEGDETDAQTEPASAAEPPTLESLWSDVIATEEPGPAVVEPDLLQFEEPEYTEAALLAGAEGTIRVNVLVDENGRAEVVELIEGLDQQVGLEEAVIDAAWNAVYSPATEDGVPVKMWLVVEVPYER